MVLDITPQPTLILERLITIRAQSPNGLFLVLDSENRPELSRLARIAGATLALTGFTPPPYVASLIDQWLPLAEHRAATASPVILEETKRDEQNANYLIDLELQRFNAITRC